MLQMIGAVLFSPVAKHMKNTDSEKQKLLSAEDPVDENSNLLQNKANSPSSNKVLEKLQELLGIRLLGDLSFLNISGGIALIYTVSINFSLLFPFFLQDTANLSRGDTALAMSILASGDVLSRLTLPIVTDRFKISARVTLLVGLALLICIRSVLAETQSPYQILIFSWIFGYIRAATVVNQNLCLAEYCSDQKVLSSALGLTMILKACAVITIGQLLGYTRDLTKSYSTSLHLQNVVLAIVVILWAIELICQRRRNVSKEGFERLAAVL